MKNLLVLTACWLSLVAGSPASAQELTERQFELNNSAVQAIVDGDYDQAVRLLEESLSLGEFNVTLLNLGRAYAKQGKCQKALATYDRLVGANQVESPDPERVYQVLKRYRQELKMDCEGTVVLRCQPTDLQVTIDGGEPRPCFGEPVSLPAGSYTFSAIQDGKTIESRVVSLDGLETRYVDLKAGTPEAELLANVATDSGVSPLEIAGWSISALGATVLLSAIVYDIAVITPSVNAIDDAIAANDFAYAVDLRDSVEQAQDANIALFATGGSLTALGIALVIWSVVDEDVNTTPVAFPSSSGYAAGLSTSW